MIDKNQIISEVTSSLKITDRINSIYLESVHSPWEEKALIKRKKDNLEVMLKVWDDSSFIYGRIYRLFLYIFDVLTDNFNYDPQKAPDEEKEPRLKDRHNQIWSIYVDSRVEKRGIENFFDRTTRRNIFVDSEKQLSWREAVLIFNELWNKEVYTYPEITQITYNLSEIAEKIDLMDKDSFECVINRLVHQTGVQRQIERLPSGKLRNIINELLSFAAYQCKDTHIGSSYYGITMAYNRRLYAEIIPTEEDIAFLTIIDPLNNQPVTRTIVEETDIKDTQKLIQETYKIISQHSQI